MRVVGNLEDRFAHDVAHSRIMFFSSPKQHVVGAYCKDPKFWDARNLFCNLHKIQTKR